MPRLPLRANDFSEVFKRIALKGENQAHCVKIEANMNFNRCARNIIIEERSKRYLQKFC